MASELEKLIGLDVDVPKIQLRQIDSLVPYARNSRTHSPAQVEELQRLLIEFGWTNPVLIDEMGIVAGHGRIMATQKLYECGKQITFPNGSPIPIGFVPTLDCTGWSDAQRRAYIIADNRSALSAGWDEEMLKLELRELEAIDYDLALTAFSDDELDLLLAPDLDELPEADPDAAPAERETAVSVAGDVWICGPHRVACGDSTSIDDWDRLMQGERADACWTDPPYNVDLGRKNKLLDKTLGGKRFETGAIANDKMSAADFADLIAGIYASLFAVLKPGAAIYVAHSDKAGGLFRHLFEQAGFHFSQMLIWKKNTHVLGMADFQPIHEPVIYGWKPGSKHRWYGGRKQTTVMAAGEGGPISQLPDGRWAITVGDSVLIVSGEATLEEAPSSIIHEPKPERSGLHASQKPVNLVERMLKNSTRAGDIVVDACGGSGSTLIAADRLGMSARLMELNPTFVDVIVRRWQDYTGRRAVHAETGEPFPSDDELPEVEQASEDEIRQQLGDDIF
ncbi:MAG: site-specific DNA-methyltransferase [Armatimonadia bacterium]